MPEPTNAPADAPLDVDALLEGTVVLVVGLVTVTLVDAVPDIDIAEDEDGSEVAEGKESDEGWLARLQNCWANNSVALSSCGHKLVVQLTMSCVNRLLLQ